jgi:hypothetical protein
METVLPNVISGFGENVTTIFRKISEISDFRTSFGASGCETYREKRYSEVPLLRIRFPSRAKGDAMIVPARVFLATTSKVRPGFTTVTSPSWLAK